MHLTERIDEKDNKSSNSTSKSNHGVFYIRTLPCTQRQMLCNVSEPSLAGASTTTASTVAATTQTAGKALLTLHLIHCHSLTVSSPACFSSHRGSYGS